MANLVKVTRHVRTLDQSYFSDHSGNVYVEVVKSEDGAFEIWHIYAASPTASNFNAAPVGSLLFDTDDWTVMRRHNTATTWIDNAFA